MTQEDKDLLLKDLCGRLPYGVMVHFEGWCPEKLSEVNLHKDVYNDLEDIPIPYLRPMSSMTEEEANKLASIQEKNLPYPSVKYRGCDYLNSIHVDYRGLIPMGLALEAPEDMYKTK